MCSCCPATTIQMTEVRSRYNIYTLISVTFSYFFALKAMSSTDWRQVSFVLALDSQATYTNINLNTHIYNFPVIFGVAMIIRYLRPGEDSLQSLKSIVLSASVQYLILITRHRSGLICFGNHPISLSGDQINEQIIPSHFNQYLYLKASFTCVIVFLCCFAVIVKDLVLIDCR